MQITKIYAGNDGHSHFQLMEVFTTESTPFNGIDVLLSQPENCENVLLHEFPGNYVLNWHNPPQEQYVIILEGCLEIKLHHGETQKFEIGEVFLAADLSGTGHVTRALKQGKAMVINKGKQYEIKK